MWQRVEEGIWDTQLLPACMPPQPLQVELGGCREEGQGERGVGAANTYAHASAALLGPHTLTN